jgi:hypothetical protein
VRFQGPAVARELDRLLSDSTVTTRCREVARRFAGADPLAQTCRLVEELGSR